MNRYAKRSAVSERAPHNVEFDAHCAGPGERRCLLYVAATPNGALVDGLRADGWHVIVAPPGARSCLAARQLEAGIALIDMSGCAARELHAVETVLRHSHLVWVAAVSGRTIADSSVRRLVRGYCFDYVTLPVHATRISAILGHALGMAALNDDGSAQRSASEADDSPMVGRCEAMQKLFRSIRKVARTSAPVFVSGESGTGKELTALAIHHCSPRGKAPFVAINCGAIPNHLLHSELFGFERGAFTGAGERKIGRVEAANGGTLFLDEIGDLPLESQASLLRFLQEGSIERLGGHASIPVDVRIVSATHIDLEAAVAAKRFRQDLYHRLCVLRLEEPPLRVRGKDIELLAQHMLCKYKADSPRAIRGFAPCALEAMHGYEWPGNVRELINRVRRAIVMSESKVLTAIDLGLQDCGNTQATTLVQAREAAERAAIEAALLRHQDRINEAAAELGVSRSTLYRLMVRYALRDAMPEGEAENMTGTGGADARPCNAVLAA